MSPPTPRHTRTTRALHWLQAALLLGLVALGWYLTNLDYYDRWYNDALFWHRALGLLVPLIAAGQLACRFQRRYCRGGRAELPAAGAPWEQRAAAVTHRTFLLLMFLIPISGYLISTAAGAAVPLPGGLQLPAIAPINAPLRDLATTAHYYLAYTIATLAALHATATAKHHLIDHNPILRRMW